MDKGIRNGVNVQFAAMLPQLPVIGGKAFRRAILDWTVENYGVTMASASTHYNFSLHAAKKATPELVAGLGRPEGKNNGGRKKGNTVPAVVPFETVEQYKARMTAELNAPVVEAVIVVEAAVSTEQTEFEVRVKKTDAVVATALSFEAAKALVEKAKAAKKATLYWI